MNPTVLVIIGTYGTIAFLYFCHRYLARKSKAKWLKSLKEIQKPLSKLNDLEKEPLPEEDLDEEYTLESYDSYSDEEDEY